MTYEKKKERDTKELINFIINEKLDLEEYYSLVPKISKKFMVNKPGKGIETFTDQLVEAVINWERGNQHCSLEKLLYDNFLIYKRV